MLKMPQKGKNVRRNAGKRLFLNILKHFAEKKLF